MCVVVFFNFAMLVFCAVIFLLWAYLPADILHSVGVSYYPSRYAHGFATGIGKVSHCCVARYWAIALPSYVCVLVVLVFVMYSGINMMMNPSLDSVSTLTGKPHPYSIDDGAFCSP